MATSKSISPNPISKPNALTAKSVQLAEIMLIEGGQQLMPPLAEALSAAGYATRLFHDTDKALFYLSKVDILLIDTLVAEHPKSSKLIKASTIVVLSTGADDKLPPWLEARHVFLFPYPETVNALIKQLTDNLLPPVPNFGTHPSDAENLAILFGISQHLSGHFLDINDLFERVLALAPYLEADFSALLIQEGDETVYYRSTQPGREELFGPAGRRFAQRLLKDGLEGWVLRHNQAVILANTLIDSRWFRASYLPDQEHCAVVLPISLERVEARGIYLIGHLQTGYFSSHHLSLFKAVTDQISLAIENAMLFKNQSERSMQLSLINEVGQAATSILNLEAMLRTVVQAIWRSFGFYRVSIHLYNPITQLVELRARATSDHQARPHTVVDRMRVHHLRQGLIGWAVATNKTILANDVTRDPRYIFDSSNREVRSELCVPITMGTKTIGVLDLQSTRLEAFDKYHVSALETLGDQLAIAIENARLYDKINQACNRVEIPQPDWSGDYLDSRPAKIP